VSGRVTELAVDKIFRVKDDQIETVIVPLLETGFEVVHQTPVDKTFGSDREYVTEWMFVLRTSGDQHQGKKQILETIIRTW
jgi:hypothetical protein